MAAAAAPPLDVPIDLWARSAPASEESARVRDLELTEPRAGDSDRFGSDRPLVFCSACACAAALQVTAPNSVVRRRCVLRAERFPYTGRGKIVPSPGW